jgi:hypothetical protein
LVLYTRLQCPTGKGLTFTTTIESPPESTHFTDPKRLRKLFALLTLALAWSLKTGLELHQLHPIPLKKHGRRARSLFRLGFDHLRRLVLNPSFPNFRLFLDSLHFLSCT